MKFAKSDTAKTETILQIDISMTLTGETAKRVEANAAAHGMEPAAFLTALFGDVAGRLPLRPKTAKLVEPVIHIPAWVPADLHAEYRYIAKNSGEEDAAAWARDAKRGRA